MKTKTNIYTQFINLIDHYPDCLLTSMTNITTICLLRTNQQRSFHGRTWIITTFVLIDTAMTNLDHQTDVRAGVPESEIATVARVAAKYFANNHRTASA